MEDLLKEILFELKKINNKLYQEGANIKVTIDEDVLVEKVIDSINGQNRISGKTTIAV